jgi:CrcB protein
MKLILAVAMGGAIGAVGRHLVAGQVMRLAGGGFPFGTMTVNILGSFILGVLVELMAVKWSVGQELRGFIVVGMLGGFTTFSAFSLDAVLLYERGNLAGAAAYVLATVIASLGGMFAGLAVCRQVIA